jgi:two-component system cell cycle sensor histidine kinase/response regulator CckA
MKEKKTGSFILSYGKFILLMAIVLLVSAVLIFMTYQGVKREMIDLLNTRQMIHAKQATKGIEAFFHGHIDMLQQLAKNEHLIDLDATGKRMMRDFYSFHPNTISIITRIDRQGRILNAEPHDPNVVGKAIVSMASFQEARSTGQVSVSDVFTNLRGLKTIIVHVPVFKGGAFNGSIAILFPFDLIARYVEDIRIGRDGYAWVISRDGTELSCPVPGHAGNSVFDNCRDFPDILAMAERMMRGEEGVTTYQFDRIRGDAVRKTTKYAVFMPVRLANNFWSIVVATPEDEVMATLEGFRNRLLLITLMLIVAMGFFFYFLFRTRILTEEIGRRQKTEAALQAKTEELDRYFTNSLDLLCIADTDGYFRRLNPEWEKTLGYPLSELEGKRFLDFVHLEDLESTIAAINELAGAREVLNFVNRYRCRDGSYRWIEWRSYPVENLIYAVARDITTRKGMEGALKQSEKRYRGLFDHAVEGIYQSTPEGRFIAVNQAMARMCGYESPEEMIAAITDISTQYYVDPRDRETYKSLLDANSRIDNIEYRVRRKDGSAIWVAGSSRVVRNDQGDTLYYEGRCQDITARKQAEDALRESEKQYRSVIENIQDVFYRSDREGRLLMGSPSGVKLFGYKSLDEMTGMSLDSFWVNPAEREKLIQQIRSDGGVQDFEALMKKKNGTPFHASFTTHFYYDDQGAFLGTEGIIRNITARKRAEAALRESEQKYRLIAENSTDVIWTMSLDGRFTYVSPAVTTHAGFTPEEAMGMTLDTYLYKEDLPRVMQEISQELQKPKEQRALRRILEVRQYKKNGSVLDVEVSVAWLYDEQGNVIGLQGSTRDISTRRQAEAERKKLEAQLQQAQKMESIGTLAGGIAHDFNNLLMGIQGYASSMLMALDEGHPHYEKLRAIEEQVQSGANLTKQLLGFARGGRYEVKPTDLNDLIRKTAAMFGRTKKEIRIHEKYGEGIWTVDTDRGQMDQVLLNLFVNAWQAMPGGGDLFLQTDNVNLDAAYVTPYETRPGPYVKVSVTDTGVGMDEKTRQRIFDPFFTTREMGRGTGLGLASAYGIIKGHGGFINVYSEKGHGTTFNIYLPASNREVVREAPSAGAIPRGHETILVVDDERMILDVTREMIEGLGYRVLIAQGGADAMETYRVDHGKIDLVILDMIMPGMGGGELLDRMQAVHADVRVILSSGYSLNGEAKTIMERGARLFLQKPFRLDNLSQKIREALEK